MSDPLVASREPIRVELEPGSYWWCRCGRSKDQPWCDGSHAGTGIEPQELELKRKKKLWLCLCKATGSSPFCDGSHENLAG